MRHIAISIAIIMNHPQTKISPGVVHKAPPDLRRALAEDKTALKIWEGLTPLARNEWICWTTFPKKAETKKAHVQRVANELKAGKRRPCCWLGCMHRKDKPLSPSVKHALGARQSNKKK